MRKYTLICILISIIIVGTIGCSNRIVENDMEVENVVPSGLKNEIGSGSFSITTSNFKNDVPVIFADEFKGLAQLGFQSEGFDGSKCSYIYIDGKLNTIEQLGEMNVDTLTVDKEQLSNGIHKVEVIQFDNNKISGTPITYKVCKYEVRSK